MMMGDGAAALDDRAARTLLDGPPLADRVVLEHAGDEGEVQRRPALVQVRDVAHDEARRPALLERLRDRPADALVEALEVRPLGGGLERLHHYPVREQLVAQVGRREAAPQPGLAGRAAEPERAARSRLGQRTRPPEGHLLALAL